MNVMKTQSKKHGAKTSKKGEGRLSRFRPQTSGLRRGVALFLFVLLGLCALAGVKTVSGPPQFMTGEVADRDAIARRDFLVEDTQSTQAKRSQVAKAQPRVFDLSSEPHHLLESGVMAVFDTVNSADVASLEDVRWQIAEDLNAEISKATLMLWRREDFQNLVLARVLPWMGKTMSQGVIRDEAAMQRFDNGILVRNLDTGMESLRMDVAGLKDMKTVRSDLAGYLKAEMRKPLVIRKAVWALVGPLSAPSLVLNREESRVRIRQAVDSVEPVYFHVRQGEVVVRTGEVVTESHRIKLRAMSAQAPESFTLGRGAGLFMLTALMALGLFLSQRAGLSRVLVARDYVLLSMVMLIFGGGAKFLALAGGPFSSGVALLTKDVVPYSLPVAGGAGVLALFFPHAVCLFGLLILSFLCAQMVDGGMALFAFYFVSGLVQVFVVKKAESRSELMSSVLPLLGGMSLAWVGVCFMNYQGMPTALAGGMYVLVGGLLSLIFLLALSPIAESLFGYSSRFRLMELMSLERPLLQQLMVEAPGTYHHSLILSNMVEAGARAIGANALLCKVAALYHDIGKMTKPQYFIENQMGGENKHDKLAPSMSALILISHVKKGVELGREHKLGLELEDMIQQHHGTMLISYFHHKAVEQAEAQGEDAPSEVDFRYPGPKPQTKEAGLLLLADAIEASSRTLGDPTPSRIKGHIEKIIKKIFLDGQLDESELTLKDLHRISEVFHRILTGVFHHRIEYPDGEGPKAEDAKPRGGNGRKKPEGEPQGPGAKGGAKGESGRNHKPEQDPTGQSSAGDTRDAGTVLKFTKSRESR